MASPFAAFRKYQAILLAFFGVIIILLFAVGDPLSRMSQEQQHEEDPVAVKYSGGEIKELQLRRMIYGRSAAGSLLAQIRLAAQYPQIPAQYRSQLRLDPRELILTDESLSPEATIHSMLLANKATELGMQVSWPEVWDYLRDKVAMGAVTKSQIQEMIEEVQDQRDKRTIDDMLAPIRQEILARKLFDFLARGLMSMPPAEQFSYFNKVYQKSRADVIAIPVDQYLDKVAEPKQEELAAYFDRYKEKLPHTDPVGVSQLASATPGFKLPHRAKVQYLKANFGEYVDRARPQVTEAEIAKFYDENKERFPQQDLPLIEDNKEKKGDKKETDKKDAGKKETEKKDAEKNDAVKTDSEKKEPVPDTKPAVEATDGAPQEKSPADAAGENTPPSATKTPTASPAAVVEVAQADEKPPVDKNADAKEKDAPAAPAAPATQPAAEGTAAPTQPVFQGTGGLRPAAAPPAKVKPLSEVKDEIHKILAEQKAAEAIEKTFQAVNRKITDNIDLRLQVGADPKKKLPPLLDFNDLAKKHDLTAHTTGLLSARQMFDETDIGKSYDPQSGQPYIALVYSGKGEHSLHHVLMTADDSKDQYLSWKIEDEDEKVPALEGVVKQDVIKHWKRGAGVDDVAGKARALALAAAEQLAAKVRKGESVAAAAKSIAGAKLIETDPFSWLTHGELRSRIDAPNGPPRLSEIEGIDDAGDAFMEKVFSLKPGEVGVAQNHPGTYVYVIKVRNQETSPRVLMETFMADMTNQVNRMEVGMATQLEVSDLARKLFEKLDEDAKLKWEIPASDIATRTRG